MAFSPVDEAWLAQMLDEAVAPFVGKVDADELAWMREQLADRIRTDEGLAALARGAQPRTVESSGEVAYGTEPEAEKVG